MKPTLMGACWAVALLAAGAAHAQDAVYARNLASACFTCHGTDGRSVGNVPPPLAGRDRGELLQILMEFKAGKRPATIMHQQAKGYTDQQLETIAGYFSGIARGQAAPAPAGRVNF